MVFGKSYRRTFFSKYASIRLYRAEADRGHEPSDDHKPPRISARTWGRPRIMKPFSPKGDVVRSDLLSILKLSLRVKARLVVLLMPEA